MTTKIIAFALLGIFYAAYFGKKIAQKRQGIQTNQIGVGNKPKRILRIERLMGAATLWVVPVEVVSIAVFPQWTLLPWLQNCPALQRVGLTVTTNAPYTDIARRALLPHFLRHCIRSVLQTSTTVLVILIFLAE